MTDVLVAGIYSAFGALGVILFFAAVTSVPGCSERPWRLRAWPSSWLACAISPGSRCRISVQEPSSSRCWTGSPLVAVETLEEGSASVRWWIPPLFLLWANLHGGFVAGLLQLSLIIGTTAIVRWLSDRQILFSGRLDEPLFSWMEVKRLTAIMALSACLTLLNPYGWRLYLEIVDSLSNRFMLETLQEWQPLSMAGLAGRRYAMYLAGLIVAMALWYRRIEPVRWVVGVVFSRSRSGTCAIFRSSSS